MVEQGSIGFEFCVSAGEGTLIDYGLTSPEDMDTRINELWPDRFIRIMMPDIAIGDAETTILFTPASPDCLTGK